MYELKDWLNSINISKQNLIDENPESEKSYPPFVINKCLGSFIDTILYVNELNINYHLDKKLQYDFLINSLRPKKRYSPWLKKGKIDSLELVKQYYGYNDQKAKIALSILSKEQIEFIKSKMNRGGKK